MARVGTRIASLALAALLAERAVATTHDDVQARIERDLAAGKPIVAHVVVALCDNEHQGIVPVPKQLGNGRDPRTNLYWGALYGVRTHFAKHGWQRLAAAKPDDARVLERSVFVSEIRRGERSVPVYVVADAWDGERIEPAIRAFLEMSAGRAGSRVAVKRGDTEVAFAAGGGAQLVAFVGHDGLMDFEVPAPAHGAGARAAIVLACSSQAYFGAHLASAGAHPLLLTTGLMAPEAYTLDAALRAWARGEPSANVREAAAQAYHAYQQCGLRGARGLFTTAP